MAQVFGDKDMKNMEHPISDDPLHEVKEQIQSGVGTMKSEPLFDGASVGEKLPESRVGETLLTDNVQKLDSTEAPMDTEEDSTTTSPFEEPVVKRDVAETFANEFKETRQGSGDKKEESTSDDSVTGKSGAAGNVADDDSQGGQEHQGMKFKKLTGAGIPRGKPHFRVSANHGNRGLGDASLQSGGLGGGPGSSGGLRGGSRGGGGLARTGSGLGSGLARTGSGIPRGNNDLSDFSAALAESDSFKSDKSDKSDKNDSSKSLESPSSLPPSTDAKVLSAEGSDDKQSGSTASETATETKDAAEDKLTSARDAAAEKMAVAKDSIMEKATAAKDMIVEKSGEMKTGFVATMKDQLVPVKDPQVSTSDMEVDGSAPAKFDSSLRPKLGIYKKD